MQDIEALYALAETHPLASPEEIQWYQQYFLGKKGVLEEHFAQLKRLPPSEKKILGQKLNALKTQVENRLRQAKEKYKTFHALASPADPTLPLYRYEAGARHILSMIEEEVEEIFRQIGYLRAEGPEIEDDWHNFTALNFEPDHPAREMQDTFFLEETKNYLLRTHTSTVQVRVMSQRKPPIRILAPGRVYRRENVSARAHVYFHQIEGLYVDEGVSFSQLKATLRYFVEAFFGSEVKYRLRASYFPFTEMSAELDIGCLLCQGEGCPVCKYTGWVEILGCGMVDPAVLTHCGIDAEKYQGFAFGMGVERLAQLRYQIPDLRLFGQNDLRFLKSFQGYVGPAHHPA
ncbi:MAG: phenylalanine--tRNA ligase subunit alpha [Bacteroidia bacterium]